MPNLGPLEITLIVLVILLIFGAKRLPDLARGVGRSLRIFKSETKGLMDEETTATSAVAEPVQPAALPPSAPSATESVPAPVERRDA